jgi:thioredoxin 1
VLTEFLIRALWAVLIAGLLLSLYWVVNKVILARVRGKQLGLENLRPGVPAILYFTTPGCVPCKTVQRPALARLQEHLGDSVQVIEVDAAAQPNLADYWGVLSVPTTFIIDARGQARRVNHGVASADKLQAQIKAVARNRSTFAFLKKRLLKSQSKRNYS